MAGGPDPTPAPGWVALVAARMPAAAADRVHIRRALRRIGAVAIRDGVYALPDTPESRAALAEVARRLDRRRGAALPCTVHWLDPRDHQSVRRAWDRQHVRDRQVGLAGIARLERIADGTQRARAADRRTARARLTRLRRRIDAMAAPPSAVAPALVPPSTPALGEYRARTWVTRRGVRIDRIASAWLIRRFVDPAARFRFVGVGDAVAPDALRFDMPGGEFTHVGGRCTFETLVARLLPGEPALRPIAEIVHDLDLEDGRYGRPEAAGVAQVIAGLAAAQPDDDARLVLGQTLFDCLYASFRGPTPRPPQGALP